MKNYYISLILFFFVSLSFLFSKVTFAENVIKIGNFYLTYPSYYIKVELYNENETKVLLDSRNQDRTIYIEIVRGKKIKQIIDEIIKGLDDFYENKYKILKNEKSNLNERNLYIIQYSFMNLDRQYINLKYYIEVSSDVYIGVYGMAPSNDFNHIYSDLSKILSSFK